MLVNQILNSKKNNFVETVERTTSVKVITDILVSKKIGSVIISSDGQILEGIVSERDIVRTISQHGRSALDLKASNIMTKKLYACKLDTNGDHVLFLMNEKRFRRMPVVEGGRLVGIITQGDVVKAKLSEISMEKDALESMIAGY